MRNWNLKRSHLLLIALAFVIILGVALWPIGRIVSGRP